MVASSPPTVWQRGRAHVAEHALLWGFIAAALLVRVAFWAYTGRVWEDALITLTHARNAVEGYGLTHHAGEPRVHGFTSALSVLVPLVGEPLRAGLLMLRLATLAATVVTLWEAYFVGRLLALGRPAQVFLLAYLAFDETQIFYGISGMESQMAVAILLGGVHALLRERVLAAGVWAGLALLARPDLVLWVVPAGALLLWRRRREALPSLIPFFALMLPWVIFCLGYYGSVVPHTSIRRWGSTRTRGRR